MSKIFDNVADVARYLGVPVSIPSVIPEDCNILCYSETTGEVPCFYRECGSLIYYIDRLSGECWKTPRRTLEKEVAWDKFYGYKLAYLRLAAKDNSDAFTPERLLGVKSNKGFVTAVYQYKWNNEGFVVDFDGEGQYQPSAFKYYISDDSDETISFEDYVRMFYEE